jgi:hypothetical protein
MPCIALQRGPSETLQRYQHLLEDALEADPSEFGRKDIALLNLLCAPSLAGSENIDIQHCLSRLDRLAAHVKATIERNLYRAPGDPEYGHCEPMWRMAMLVTCVKLDFGAAYDRDVRADLDRDGRSPFTDSRNVFIHGLLNDNPKRRWGSCSSIPVLVTAVARRLGYPVGLAVNRRHVWARWEDERGLCFNVEASNLGGMTVESDEHYGNGMFGPMTEVELRSGFYVRMLRPAEEFSLFLKDRVWCLNDMARYEQTFLWSARALQYGPDDPHFAKGARMTAELAIKHRYRQRYPTRPIPPPERNHEFFYNLGELVTVPERAPFLTILAHCDEQEGSLDKARERYEDACRQNLYGYNEQRDLQRFLRKQDLPRRGSGPLMPPNLGQPRRFKLYCKPHEEADVLRWMVDKFEREGAMLNCRNALLDLYAFDPSDAELYQRLRTLEKRPEFQAELKEDIRRRGQTIRPAARAEALSTMIQLERSD